MSDFAENLRKAMFAKRLKGVDVANATKITPSVISRYLTGAHQPSADNLLAISKYLGISPEALLSSSEAPESSGSSRYIYISDKDKVIAVQEELIKNLQKQVGDLERQVKTDEVRNLKAQVDMLKAQNDQWKASSQDRHAKGKAKADLAISKHKNTLRIKTTRKPKK